MDGKHNEKVLPIDIDPGAASESPVTGAETPESAKPAGTEDQLSKLKAENAAYLDRLARVQAEFDNFRKRSARDQEEYRAYAIESALKQLLPILDSMDHALKAENSTAENFRAGMELIDRQFHDVLAKLGVDAIEAVGKPFDPNLHQAIQMVEDTEVPDHHVVDELQRGYKLRDRLLRPSMVRVSQNPGK